MAKVTASKDVLNHESQIKPWANTAMALLDYIYVFLDIFLKIEFELSFKLSPLNGMSSLKYILIVTVFKNAIFF